MFQRLGNFAAHYRKWIVAGWILLAAILTLVAPPLNDVSSTDQKDFLPADAPFVRAQAVYEAAFPSLFTPSSTMLLIDAGEGGNVRGAEVWNFIAEAEAWLNSDEAPDNIGPVAAPTTDPEMADALISPDGQIALISIALTTIADAVATTDAVNAIDDWLAAHESEQFTVYQTGEAGLSSQISEVVFSTMDRTLVITITLIIVALLVIYRSPVSPLIPLFSVTLAYLTATALLSLLAKWDLITVVTQVNTIMIVVMYGAGTDFNLFLISRFREEMADGIGTQQATRNTVRLIGAAISTSAGTVTVGFMSMIFAEMGMFKSAGPMLATGIVISLLAGLTLTPALLTLLGNRAFWPFPASHRSPGRFYRAASQLVSSRPLTAILVIVAVMLPFSAVGLSRDLNFNILAGYPEDIPSVKGYNLIGEHMGQGFLFPLTVVVTGRDPETMPQEIARLTAELAALDGVVDVQSLNTPLGTQSAELNQLLRVDGQLTVLLGLAEGSSGENTDLQQALALVTAMQNYLTLLTEHFPKITTDANFVTAQEIVNGGLATIGLRQAELMTAVSGLRDQFAAMDNAYLMPPTGAGELFAAFQPMVAKYIAGNAYRLDVMLDNPMENESRYAVAAIRNLLKEYKGNGDAVASGISAVLADTMEVLHRDRIRVYVFVLSGIFVMLSIMLRSLVAPTYLIGTVLLSYTCTLGITGLFFQAVYGIERLNWMLPIFMFVFLVALGIDYSILLFGRIREEVGYHGIREGIHVAVGATGVVITSAAVILAGTFAGMMIGEIMLLVQLGFAVSVGVLIDAFVVRTILDPALAGLFGRWTWWPGGVPKAETPRAAQPQPAPEIAD